MKLTNNTCAIIILTLFSVKSVVCLPRNSAPDERDLERKRTAYLEAKNKIIEEALKASQAIDAKVENPENLQKYHKANPLPDGKNFAATLNLGQKLGASIYAVLGERRQFGIGHYRATDSAGFAIDPEDHRLDTIELIVRPDGKFALPGGFVDASETSRAAAARECTEETNMNATILAQIATVDTPGRDKRAPVSTDVFYARLTGTPKSTNEALIIVFKTEEECNKIPADRWAFDHQKLVEGAWNYHRLYQRVASMDSTRTMTDADLELVISVLCQYLEQQKAQSS